LTGLLTIGALVASIMPCCKANIAVPEPVDPAITAAIAEASDRFAIPRNWIGAVISVESGGNVNAHSPKGAMGLMQIMPSTWAPLQLRYHLGANPFDIHDNIIAGTGLLRELYDRFGASGFLAAYNAGSSRYISSLLAGQPLSQETQHYLTKLAPLLDEQPSQAMQTPTAIQDWREAPLFAMAWSIATASVQTASLTKIPDRTKVEHPNPIPNASGLFAMPPVGIQP
jgi:Transglycosylase SLT domain